MTKGKYIIREVPAGHSDFNYYFEDDGLTEAGGDYCYNLFIVNNVRYSRGFNDAEYQNIQTEIEELLDNYDDIINKYECAQYSSVGVMLLGLGLIDNIHNTKRIKEIKDWLNACQERPYRSYTTMAEAEPEETTAEYLTFKTGKRWKTEIVRGYCQGEMVTIVYCEDHYTYESARAYGEIWLGMGKEFYTIELDENGEEVDRCGGYIVANSQVKTDEDYKTLVCEWACIDEDETILELIDGYKTVMTYEYKKNMMIKEKEKIRIMNVYIAITRRIDNRYISSVIRVAKSDNLLSVLHIKGIIHANICSSKKKAQELSDFWNECYKNNGTYLYQD